MDHASREKFASHMAAMNSAGSNFELWEARNAAEMVAREHRMSFDKALLAHRAGWPADDEESTQISSKTTPLPAAAAGDDHCVDDEEATDASAHLRSSDNAEAPINGAEIAGAVQSCSSDGAEAFEKNRDHLSIDATARNAIAAALVADPTRSDRDIARETGTSPTTVGKARAAAGLQRLVRKVMRGGSTYDMAAGRDPDPTDAT